MNAACDLPFRTFSAPQDPLRPSPLFRALSGQVLEAVRKLGLEGVIGKRLGSAYKPGERSGAALHLFAKSHSSNGRMSDA